MYGLLAHSLHHDVDHRTMDRLADSLKRTPPHPDHDAITARRTELSNRLNQESIETCARARNARSALKADLFLLKMHYKDELAKPLVDTLQILTNLATDFLPTQGGGRTPEYEKVKDLPVDNTVDKVHEEIESLWVNTSATSDY